MKTLMDQVKLAIGSSKYTAFAAPKYNATSSSSWAWGPAFYYYMARHVDYLIAMEYDSGKLTGSDYQSWMTAQTENILKAVSGEYWTDGSHTAPTNGVKVYLGFSAYPDNSPTHVATAETTKYAALGTTSGLATLDSNALNVFGAAAVYLTKDGTGSDGYASWSTDWNNLAIYW